VREEMSRLPRARLVPSRLPRPSGPLLIVGDIVCDRYVWGDVDRISPEAPVQVVRWGHEANRAGGAANVAMNAAALGCVVRLVGLIGRDAQGRWLRRALRASGVDISGVIEATDRPTTVKTRVIARGQQLLRIDREVSRPAHGDEERRLLAAVTDLHRGAVGVVCSDYAKGVLTAGVLAAVLHPEARRAPHRDVRPFVLVDPKGRDLNKYRGADILTPNDQELMEADTPALAGGAASLDTRARRLVSELGLGALFVTRGAEGLDVFEATPGARAVSHVRIPVLQRHEVFDVTGAGDTVAAVAAVAAAAGAPWLEAARFANAAAGMVVGSVGTTVVDAEALARVVDGGASPACAKVVPHAALAAQVATDRARGMRIVLAIGCFDLLHARHVHLLQRARALGDSLVVVVTSDERVGDTNGRGRPVLPAEQRAEVVASLRFVDCVTILVEPHARRVIRRVRPDILVTGDGETSSPDERLLVERCGGRIEAIRPAASLLAAVQRDDGRREQFGLHTSEHQLRVPSASMDTSAPRRHTRSRHAAHELPLSK
jgi:D-beta-D-heptose 7-phosphate kinase/D-beta-D-heptose 1-phosphate adenosyltransferase